MDFGAGKRRAKSALLLALPCLLAACSAPYVSRREVPEDEMAARRAIAGYAAGLVGTLDLRPLGNGFKNDCSGFVGGVFQAQGRRIEYKHVHRGRSLSESLYKTLWDRDLIFTEFAPNVADVVFFRNTTERSFSSDITHVGLVEAVGDDGTVDIIHYSSGSVNRIRMNLKRPRERTDPSGKVINHYIRRAASGSPRRDYLAGSLFVGYGDLVRYTQR